MAELEIFDLRSNEEPANRNSPLDEDRYQRNMSITPTLKAAARSAYRELWRAATGTFTGDENVLQAWRFKMRQDAIGAQSIADAQQFEAKATLAREVANVLRRNIVQARREVDQHDEERWKIKITEHTELADNDSIKPPPPMSTRSGRGQRKAEQVKCSSSSADAPPTSSVPRFFSQLKKAHKSRTIPELNESDLEEKFVRGSGPGGQSINKTQNNVQLLHKPSGIRVTCQETRSLETNRKFARRILLDKIEQLQNPGLSKSEMQKAKQIERERRRRKKAKKKAREREASGVTVNDPDD